MPDPFIAVPRSKVDRLRALAAFQAAVSWLYACLLGAAHEHDEYDVLIDLRDVHPGMKRQIEDAVVIAVRMLDPLDEARAHRRAQQAVAERLADILSQATQVELLNPQFLSDRARELTDAALGSYRGALVHPEVAPFRRQA